MERGVFHQCKYSFGESTKFLGERKCKEEEQNQDSSRESRSEVQESGSVSEKRRNKPGSWWAKVSGKTGKSDEREMLSWMEGSPQTVRGPEGDTLGGLCSVAAPGPCCEATLPQIQEGNGWGVDKTSGKRPNSQCGDL